MNEIINRLTDAARATGETIENVRPLELEPSRPRMSWLVPVAAATAVMAAIAGGTVFVAGGGLSSAAAPASPPKFFVDARPSSAIIVRAVDGGAETDRISDPGDGTRFSLLQAAQDNRLFYAASSTGSCGSSLYRMMLDENGKISQFGTASATPPPGNQIVSLAVSGDGSKLAYALHPCAPGEIGGKLVVMDTATGESRTWASPEGVGLLSLSMSADGSKVAFQRTMSQVTAASEPSVTAVPGVPEPSITPGSLPPKVIATAAPTPDPRVGNPNFPPEVTATVTVQPVAPPTAIPDPTVTATVTPSIPVETVPPTSLTDPPVNPVEIEPARPESSVPVPTATITLVPSPGTPSGNAVPVPMPLEMSSCRFAVWRAGSAISVCADPPLVSVLDTTAPGDNLDQARTVKLPDTFEGLWGGFSGIHLSPDGERLLGLLGSRRVEVVGGTPRRHDGDSGIVAFSAEDGTPQEMLFRSKETAMQLLDVDGTGDNLLIRKDGEIGTVTDGKYRPLLPNAEFTYMGSFGTEIAW
ncbi:hypothetical protein Aph01nite_54230 [Acrocarpospora phusangensis]|uniref:Uncharacterized protein n=1 Tax=Acrocarpospora phusangensis TaxID=1070424 RepID=A0A919QE78_9ACTN|nr:hypothetical protein [Acrocarpospora phusangensis]GIH27113.1 hypothetical protein Aph01nite_54230 [Acrocarpospora phusangensis]